MCIAGCFSEHFRTCGIKTVSIWFAVGFILYFAILAGRAEVVDAMTQARDPRLVKLRGHNPLVLVPLANPASAQSMVAVANALCPTRTGRVLLLSVVAGSIKWEFGNHPPELLATQDVLREALILVPVGGKGNQDKLRARLLGSFCRSLEVEVTFLRIVPPKTTEKELKWIRYKLLRFAGDEAPMHPKVEVIRSNNIVNIVKEYADENDLVILGVQRLGRGKKVFGTVALEIARVTAGAAILISRRG